MPRINPERVLSDLRHLATFGAYKSGVHRPTLSDQDIAAREWFAEPMREAGLEAERAIAEDPATADLGVDVVVFCDEEGHFGSFFGSRSFVGLLEDREID